LIIQLKQLERLLCADCARAQDRINCDVLLPQEVTYLACLAFAFSGEPSVTVAAPRPCVLGLRMAKYEQDASLVHF